MVIADALPITVAWHAHMRHELPYSRTTARRGENSGFDASGAGTSPHSRLSLRVIDAVQMRVSAQEQCLRGDGRRCHESTVELTGGEPSVLLSRRNGGRCAFFPEDVTPAVHGDGECRVVSADAFMPVQFAGTGFDVRQDSHVADEIEFVPDLQRQWHTRHAAVRSPCKIRPGNFAARTGRMAYSARIV